MGDFMDGFLLGFVLCFFLCLAALKAARANVQEAMKLIAEQKAYINDLQKA